jgi:hypothetical protein
MNNEERLHLGEYIKSQHNGNMIIVDYHDYGAVVNGRGNGYGNFMQHEENEVVNDDTIYIGAELETGRENPFTQVMLNKMASFSKDFQCETDGSVRDYGRNGWRTCYSCEVISAPLTYDYWHKSSGYKDLLPYMISIDAKSHGITDHYTGNGCGLHFHLSKVNNWQKAVVYMAMFIDQNRFLVEAICGRPFTGYARNNISDLDEFYKKVPELVENRILSNIDHSYAINLSNSKTVEFRLCQGTLNYETFMARLEFVYHLYKQCLDIANGKARLDRLTINQVCQYGEYLPKYIKKLGISSSNKIENKTREYRVIINEFITTRNTLRHHLQALRTLLEEHEPFENIDNAKRTIQNNIDMITASSESTIENIKSALKTIKENNANTLSRALDNFSNDHPQTALAKEYKLCKEFIENLEIPTAKIEREEM